MQPSHSGVGVRRRAHVPSPGGAHETDSQSAVCDWPTKTGRIRKAGRHVITQSPDRAAEQAIAGECLPSWKCAISGSEFVNQTTTSTSTLLVLLFRPPTDPTHPRTSKEYRDRLYSHERAQVTLPPGAVRMPVAPRPPATASLLDNLPPPPRLVPVLPSPFATTITAAAKHNGARDIHHHPAAAARARDEAAP